MATPTQVGFPLLVTRPTPVLRPFNPLTAAFLEAYAAQPGRQQPIPSIRKRFLKVNDAIVTSTRMRKVQSRRKNAAKYDRTKKTPVYTVPPEILRTVYDLLDIPSRVSLSLTSKFFYEMSIKVDTGLTDLPSPVKMHPKCIRLPCVYTNHLSDRRILLLMLKKWMPHGTRLCWVCLKYTRINKYKWKETSSVNLMGINRIRLDALDDQKVKKVRCHVTCLRNDSLWSWTRQRPGTFGGFEESTMFSAHFIPKNMGGFVEYDAGAEAL